MVKWVISHQTPSPLPIFLSNLGVQDFGGPKEKAAGSYQNSPYFSLPKSPQPIGV